MSRYSNLKYEELQDRFIYYAQNKLGDHYLDEIMIEVMGRGLDQNIFYVETLDIILEYEKEQKKRKAENDYFGRDFS